MTDAFIMALNRFGEIPYQEESRQIIYEVVDDIISDMGLQESEEVFNIIADAFNDAMDRRNI